MIQLEEFQLRKIIECSAEVAVKSALCKLGLEKTQISKAEAYRRYSRRRIDRWVREGKITPVKSKGSVLFNVEKLEAVASTTELYFNHLQPIENAKT